MYTYRWIRDRACLENIGGGVSVNQTSSVTAAVQTHDFLAL